MSGGFRVKNGIICYLAAEKRALSLFMASVLVSLAKKMFTLTDISSPLLMLLATFLSSLGWD